MNKLFSLIKVEIIHGYSINKLSKKKNSNRKIGPFIATIILSLFLIGFVTFYAIMFGSICKQTNNLDFLLIISYSLGSMLCFTLTISKSNGMLFESKDFELLMSMPIKPRTIVLSKLISLLILNYMSFGLITVPFFMVYGVLSNASIIFYLLAIIAILVGPLLIITFCSFVSYLLGLLLKNVKSKSIIMSILSLIIFIAIFMLYMIFVNKMDATGLPPEEELKHIGEMLVSTKNSIMTYYPITKFLSLGLGGNYLYYLLYLAIMVVPFLGLVVFVGKNYLKANMNAKISGKSKEFKLNIQKQSNKILSLLKRDFKRFFSSSGQVLNIGIGPIISTVILVVMMINFNKNAQLGDEEFLKGFLPIMLTLTVGFTYGIMPSTSSSISLEGKNFWILKSSPLKTTDIFVSKILFYLIMCFPFIIINTVLMYIISGLSIIDLILIFIIQILLILVYAVEGLWINILTPKFDWDNEVKAIKQGTGSILSMLLGMGLGVIMYVTPFIAFSFGFNGLLVLLLNVIIVLIIMNIILFTHGKRRYENIEV